MTYGKRHLRRFVPSILVVKADRCYQEILIRCAGRAFEQCKTFSSSSVQEAARILDQCEVDLVVSGVAMHDGDIIDLLPLIPPMRRRSMSILVVSQRKELRLLSMLLYLQVAGVFDPSEEGIAALEHALAKVMAKKEYWSPSIRQMLMSFDYLNRRKTTLTRTEELVFAAIGDGSDDAAAAERLGMHPSAIHSVRRNLHRKLNIQHRGELVQRAAQYGFVRFTSRGVVRPGFDLLLTRSRRGKN